MVKTTKRFIQFRGVFAAFFLFFTAIVVGIFHLNPTRAQTVETGAFRNGEKLTYNVSFGKFENVAYAELYVASKGTIDGKGAVELQGRVKSLDLFSAVFYLLDHNRTVYVSEQTGFPLYVRDYSNLSGLPIETTADYTKVPASGLDVLTMIYKARENGGAGSYSVIENGRAYTFDFAVSGGETVTAQAGSYETTLSTVTSSYFDEYGISNVRVNFSADESHLPVQIRFTGIRGNFTALLASASRIETTSTPETAETPKPTPIVVLTPTPTPSPTPYIENQRLTADLPFKIGEKLRFSVKQNGVVVGHLELLVQSRKELGGEDTLVLKAGWSSTALPNQLKAGEGGEAWLDPFTLAPRRLELRFSENLKGLSESLIFDQSAGVVILPSGSRVEAPIGTHSTLSLLYAIRSFNLFPSKDPKNPVNDTRVAVFTNDQPIILTLRPSAYEMLEIGGSRTRAQLITIISGENAIDRLSPRIWLSGDSRRLPLRIVIGDFQADLIR